MSPITTKRLLAEGRSFGAGWRSPIARKQKDAPARRMLVNASGVKWRRAAFTTLKFTAHIRTVATSAASTPARREERLKKEPSHHALQDASALLLGQRGRPAGDGTTLVQDRLQLVERGYFVVAVEDAGINRLS